MTKNNNKLKVSIITVIRNNVNTIEGTINSVLTQTYDNIEFIVIDGKSSDGTLNILKKYSSNLDYFVSEKDDGIYDAFNKGIKASTGDIIGILNSDDCFKDKEVISNIIKKFIATNCDFIYGDMEIIHKTDDSKIVRYWKGGVYSISKVKTGWMPPHPTCYLKKEIYSKFGLYEKNFKISGDYDFLMRILSNKNVNVSYIEKTLIRMRSGGKSSANLFNSFLKKYEDYKVLKKNNISFPVFVLFWKSFSKIPQLYLKPK